MKSKTTAELPTLRELLAAGAHFGHRKEWSKPAARQFTFVVRDGVCVINLEETQARLADAGRMVEALAAEGKTVLFVGTKRQARQVVEEIGKQTGMPYAAERWLGGTLTNFSVIRSNIQRLVEIEQILTNEKELVKYTKRERQLMGEQVKKMHAQLDGIANMTRLPDLVIVVDPTEEATAYREASRLGIPVMALCDTDSDPNKIDYPIPANTDAPKTIQIILGYLANAINQGKEKIKVA